MNKTPEQYELNVKTLRQFEETFEKIKTEVGLPDPWVSMSAAVAACTKVLKPGDVAKATARSWRGDTSVDNKLIVIGTPAGALALFQITLGSSDGKPSVEERTLIQPCMPEGLYGLITKRVSSPLGPEDLAWLVDPEDPEKNNIGISLLYFVSTLVPAKPFKQTEF